MVIMFKTQRGLAFRLSRIALGSNSQLKIRSFSSGMIIRADSADNAAQTTIEPKMDVADVVIVGGGPAGLTLATALKANPVTRDLKTMLIEVGDLSKIRDYNNLDYPKEYYSNRCSSLTPTSVKYLEKIGAWDYIAHDRVKFYDKIVAYDGLVSDAEIEFEQIDIATMCENLNLQSALLNKIHEINLMDDEPVIIKDKSRVESIIKSSDTDISSESAISPEWPIVKLSDGTQVATRLLVGADGANSPVRKFAKIDSDGWAYNRFGVVASLKLEWEDIRNTAWQRFLPTGPLALLPLPGDNATLVWSTTPELSEKLIGLEPDVFCALVNAGFVLDQVDLNYLYKLMDEGKYEDIIPEVQWRMEAMSSVRNLDKYPNRVVSVADGTRARFPLRMSHAESYVAERVALVGDAAHTTHPLAGQGLNMGQGDVAALVETIATSKKRGLDIGTKFALENYWADRYPVNHVLLGVVDKLHKLYSTSAAPIVLARSLGLKAVNSIDHLKEFMIGQISGR